MDELISRQAVIDALDKRFDSIPMEQTSGILLLRKDLREMPPIQPEIVRCEECKYHRKKICPIEKYFSLNGFCSRGERMEETE